MRAKFQREVIERSLSDIKVELDSEFDLNFVRKSFFGEDKWPSRRLEDGKGSLMQRTGGLRRSCSSRKKGGALVYSSHKPYAKIHNEGGEIQVTKKMRGYFMYKLKKARGKSKGLSQEETLALAIIGSSKIKIPKRQFIGHNKSTDKIIRGVIQENMDEFFKNNKIIK